jgi:glycosyltransferase involved in cell wall biosynthesis
MGPRPSGPGKLKVVRIIARLNIGGPAIHVVNLTAGLDPSRFTSTLVTGTENPGEGSLLDLALARGVSPVVIPQIVGELTLKRRELEAVGALYRLLRAERPHVVHTHTAKAGFVGRVAARLAGVPVIVHTYHGHVLHGYYSPLQSRLLRAMERGLAVLSDVLVAVSPRIKQDLVGYRIARPEKIRVIPLGFDLKPFLGASRDGSTFRRAVGIPEAAPVIAIVGRIFPIKNHRLFLDAAARIARGNVDARFLVVGDGTLRAEMERHAATLGIRDRVVFTGWRRDLDRIYPDVDVLVVSSDNEGTPVSAIEAMASACPVVATRVGGLPDLVDHGVTGLLVPPRDPDALGGAVLELLRDRDRARRMGQAGRERARERFTLDRLVGDVEALYDELLPRPGVLRDHPDAEARV